jgi:hypothetical protein
VKDLKKNKEQSTRSLSPEMKVAKVVEMWPQTLDTFVKMGFTPLKNKFLRNTIGASVSIRQAANFKNIDLNILLHNLQATIENPTGYNQSFIDSNKLRFDENTLPDLVGDVRLMGLIPCPVRNLLIEKFDAYIQENFSSQNKQIAWWFAAEGAGLSDIKSFIRSTIKSGQYSGFPECFLTVGTELFLHDEFCRDMYKNNYFNKMPSNKNARPEFKKLEDPDGKLQLQFVALFSLYCHKDKLKGLPLPQTWMDLSNDIYKGKIVLPSLNLPIIPDLLASLYYYMGDIHFIKFCQNVSFALHPAQSSGRSELKKQPGIYITPIHFSKIMKAAEGVHVIPKDGYVAVPSYMVNTGSKNEIVDQINSYLFSDELLDLYYKCGSFIPNSVNIAVDEELDKLIVRPWSSLFDIIPDTLINQLLMNFKLEVQNE